MSNPAPFLSIITVTLNNFTGLEATWKSLQKQSFSNFEWIVIDGGSTDNTVEFLHKVNANWTCEPDDGIYDAMNKGIEKAKGRYVLFLNAGDRLYEEMTLETLNIMTEAHTKKPDFIYSDSYEAGHYKPARDPARRTWGMFTHHQSMVYNRQTIGKRRYDLNYKIAADYDFTCRFLEGAKTIVYSPFPLCIFQPGGTSQTNAVQGRKEQFKIREKLKLIPKPLNSLLYGVQTIIWNARRLTPNFYWRLKSSRNTAPGSARI